MSFKQFFKEEQEIALPGDVEVSLFIGRFQPWHNAHSEIVRQTFKKYPNYQVLIGVVKGKGTSEVKEKNPLPFNVQVRLIKKSVKEFGNKVQVLSEPFEYGFFPYIFTYLRKQDYEVKVLVGGKDRASGYMQQIQKLKDKDETVDVKMFIPNTRHLVSATQVRETIKNNDFQKFSEYTTGIEDEYTMLQRYIK